MGWWDAVSNVVLPVKGAKQFDDLATKAQEGFNKLADQGEKVADKAISAAEGLNDRMTDQFDAATQNTPLAVLQPAVNENRKLVHAAGDAAGHAAHFQGGLDKGLVDGALQLVDLPAQVVDGRLIGGLKDLGSAFIKNPSGTANAIKNTVVSAYEKDPDDFTGQVIGQVAVAVAGTKGTTAALSALKGASTAGEVARGAEAASDVARTSEVASDGAKVGQVTSDSGKSASLVAKARGWGGKIGTRDLLGRIRGEDPIESELSKLPFDQLPADQQAQLRALLFGQGPFSKQARAVFNQLVHDPKFGDVTEEARLKMLKELPNHPSFHPLGISVPLKAPMNRPGVLELTAKYDGGLTFYKLTIPGREPFTIIDEGATVEAGTSMHTPEEVAAAIRDLPDESLATFKSVRLSVDHNSQDVIWEKEFGMPEFRSYMTAPKKGEITVYPTSGKPPTSFLRTSLVHEAGHGIFDDTFGTDFGNEYWAGWRDAVSRDLMSPSQYGDKSLAEDSAESTTLYLTTRGSPLFDQYRALMPNRFAYLDKIFSGERV